MKETDEKKGILNGGWAWIGLALLALDIWLPLQFDIERLSKIDSFTIAFDWMGMFTLIIILSSCIRGRKSKRTGYFLQLIVVTFLILFFEVGTWTVDRQEKHRLLNYFVNIICNSLMLLNALCYFRFVCASLEIDLTESELASIIYSIIFAKGPIDVIGAATEDNYYLVPLK